MSDKKSKSKPSRAKGRAETPKPEAQKPEPAAKAEPPATKDASEDVGDLDQKSGWSAGELEALRADNVEMKDRLLRAVAEMENLRRRTERDKADTAKYAISNFARDVLTIADHIALAIGHVPGDALEKDDALKNFRDGILVTERELLNVMERHGIKRIDPKGERFDPNSHQAMFEVPNPDVPEGTIMEVVQAGYVIAERVLRPAMVGVSKGGEKPVKAQPASDAAPKAANDDTPKAGAAAGGKLDEKDVGGKFDTSA